jgi:hypothetical protein
MHHTRDLRQSNRSQWYVPTAAEKRRALLSLSWYSSVPEAGAHLTLSRVSTLRAKGGPSFRARAWVASRSQTAGPRLAWRIATDHDSGVRVTGVKMSPRRNRSECDLQGGTSFQTQRRRALVAQGGPQNAQCATGRRDAGHTVWFRLFELGVIGTQDGLMQNKCGQRAHQRSARESPALFIRLLVESCADWKPAR